MSTDTSASKDAKLPTKAFCLLSGGLDSTVAMAVAINQFGASNVIAVSVDYGQRHITELDHAKQVCDYYNIKHEIMTITDMPASMLTDESAEVPNASYADLPEGVSPTYVPFRNGQLLSKIAARASTYEGPSVIFAGMHAEDAERDAYPDCTMHFLGAMAAAIYIGTYHKVRLNTPLVSMFKHEIVSLGARLNAPLSLTWSCYKGGMYHCGTCPTCRARREAFDAAGVYDHVVYEDQLTADMKALHKTVSPHSTPDDGIPF